MILMFRPEDLDWRYWGLGLGFGIRDWGFSLRLGLGLVAELSIVCRLNLPDYGRP